MKLITFLKLFLLYLVCMTYVYVLRSKASPSQLYIGFTKDLKQRIKDHNRGQSRHTKKFVPWQVIYAAMFVDKQKALNFERYLKTASGKAFMRKRLI